MSPVSRRSTTRLTSPAVNAAASSRATSIVADVNSLYQPGPSATFGLGSTVTSVFAEP